MKLQEAEDEMKMTHEEYSAAEENTLSEVNETLAQHEFLILD